MRQSPPARVKQTVSGTLDTAGGRAEKIAKGTGRAVGGAATDGRKVVSTALSKAKGPSLVTGAVAAALGGGLLLGSKARPKRKVLGIPLPGRRSRLSQAAHTARKARKQIL